MSGDVARRILALEDRVLRLERLNDSLVGEIARLQQDHPVTTAAESDEQRRDCDCGQFPGGKCVPEPFCASHLTRPRKAKPAKAEKPAG